MNKIKLLAIVAGALIFSETLGLIYFSYQARKFSAKSTGLSEKLNTMQPSYDKLSQEGQELQQKYAELVKENEAIKGDRANLLTQTKKLLIEKNKTEEVIVSLGKANSDMAQLQKEKQDLESRALALKDRIDKLEASEAKLITERDDFKLAYEKARKDTTVKELRNEVANLGKVKSNLENNLKNKNKEIEQLQTQKTNLEKTKEQLINEQKRMIAKAVKTNKGLEEEVKNIPKKFSEIAWQNKKLIRETAEMHYNLGVFYSKNKEYERAIAEFEKVVEMTPDDSYAHFNLGYIYAEHLLNRKKAIEHFRHFLRLAKSDDKDVNWVKKYLLTWQTYEGKTPIE